MIAKMNQFYRYRLMIRDDTEFLWRYGRLTQEYVVDAYAKIEESRLKWARHNQHVLCANLYQGIMDHISVDDTAPNGRLILLPSSFTGGPRYLQGLYQDAMAIVRKYGKPDLFVTMTCNPKWEEISAAPLSGQVAQDRFDLCCRVFRLKLKAMIDLIVKKNIFGKFICVYVIEFQKSGLPHAHILHILDEASKPKTAEDIDSFVCVELPDPSDILHFETVTSHLIHGPCGPLNPRAACMEDGRCTKKYPKTFVQSTSMTSDGYSLYRRRQDGKIIQKGGTIIDNRNVVPYNKNLCKVFNCHINVEVCSSVHSVKYMYKYIYKGHDRVQAQVGCHQEPMSVRNEPQQCLNARYVSASEFYWRICEFSMQSMYQSVCQLQLHLENMQGVLYDEVSDVHEVLKRCLRTTLLSGCAIIKSTRMMNLLARCYTVISPLIIRGARRAERGQYANLDNALDAYSL